MSKIYADLPSLAIACASVLLGVSGCRSEVTTKVTDQATSQAADYSHDHRHQHGEGHDHEHSHSEAIQGGHAHPHEHGHRHGQPIHGGRIVSIGHSHHRTGSTQYHAEIMTANDQISFYILTEDAEGNLSDFAVASDEILSNITCMDVETRSPQELRFQKREEIEGSLFTATIPVEISGCQKFSVIVPEINLGGEPLDFKFIANAEDPGKSIAESIAEDD